MAAKLGDVPPSTVKSWHKRRQIPSWRHGAVLDAARRHGVDLKASELIDIPVDEVAPPSAAA